MYNKYRDAIKHRYNEKKVSEMIKLNDKQIEEVLEFVSDFETEEVVAVAAEIANEAALRAIYNFAPGNDLSVAQADVFGEESEKLRARIAAAIASFVEEVKPKLGLN